MGLSFHDESSMVEASTGGLRFVADDLNSVLENENFSEERRHNDSEIQSSSDSDIQMVDR